MKSNRFIFALSILGLMIGLSACAGGGFTASGWPGLFVAEDTAFVAYQNHVYAVNLDNGTERWRFPSEADNTISFFTDPILTDDGQLLAGGYNNILYSLDPSTGSQKWTFENATGRYIGSQLVTEDCVYAPTADKSLYVLDHSGTMKWTFETEREQWAKPATDGTRLFLTSMDHRIYALDLMDGDLLWSVDLGGAMVGTPVLGEEGTLYIGTFAEQMLALDDETGRVLWTFPTEDWVWSSAALEGDRIYFGDLSGMLYALDRHSGRLIWSKALDGAISATPLLTEEGLFVTTEVGSLVALTRDGQPRWTQSVNTNGGKLFTEAVAADDLILVTPIESEELLVALDSNGNRKWAFMPEN